MIHDGRDLSRVWLGLSIVGIAIGGILWTAGSKGPANIAWAATTMIGVISVAGEVVAARSR